MAYVEFHIFEQAAHRVMSSWTKFGPRLPSPSATPLLQLAIARDDGLADQDKGVCCDCVEFMIDVVSLPPPAENPEELSFKAGDLIMLKTHYGEGWFRGKLIGGGAGIFPKNFVEVVVSSSCASVQLEVPI